MSQSQEGACELTGEQSISEDEGMGFHPSALKKIEICCTEFAVILRQTAIVCAKNDGCDEVQVKHVDLARLAVGRMSPRDHGIGFYSLLGGFSFAVALAIPDTTALWFGDSYTGWLWGSLKVIVGVLIILGFVFSFRAFYLALGPRQPKWLVATGEAISKWRSTKG